MSLPLAVPIVTLHISDKGCSFRSLIETVWGGPHIVTGLLPVAGIVYSCLITLLRHMIVLWTLKTHFRAIMEENGKWIATSRVSGVNIPLVGMNMRVNGVTVSEE